MAGGDDPYHIQENVIMHAGERAPPPKVHVDSCIIGTPFSGLSNGACPIHHLNYLYKFL